MRGCLERVTTKGASGWVQVPRDILTTEEPPVVRVLIRGAHFVEGAATAPRPDVSTESDVGLGFSLVWGREAIAPFAPADVMATVSRNEIAVPLPLYRPAQLALDLNSLSQSEGRALLRDLDQNGRKRLSELLMAEERAAFSGQNERGLACVITYAQNSDAWFPYFYEYYSKIVGPFAIYVVTPKPSLFISYELGGVISAENLQFDDIARAYLISSLATGFQAYYKWSLVCDVDEFIAPYPGSGQSLLQVLAASQDDVLIARGFDILQTSGDADFDMSRPILEQRRFAVPNTAICKPHLSRVPIQYSSGYHYCQKRLDFPPPGAGLVTLHLKWACRVMRGAVARAVKETVYASQETAAYASDSVAPEVQHPMATDTMVRQAQPLASQAMLDFEQTYRNNLTYVPTGNLWIGKHLVAPFVVDLGT